MATIDKIDGQSEYYQAFSGTSSTSKPFTMSQVNGSDAQPGHWLRMNFPEQSEEHPHRHVFARMAKGSTEQWERFRQVLAEQADVLHDLLTRWDIVDVRAAPDGWSRSQFSHKQPNERLAVVHLNKMGEQPVDNSDQTIAAEIRDRVESTVIGK